MLRDRPDILGDKKLHQRNERRKKTVEKLPEKFNPHRKKIVAMENLHVFGNVPFKKFTLFEKIGLFFKKKRYSTDSGTSVVYKVLNGSIYILYILDKKPAQ